MESNRCNFEQSKALKALGYKGKTKHYFKNGIAEESYYEWDKNDHREWLCTRPTVSDAIRFFRVERGIHGHVFPVFSGTLKWGYGIVDIVEFSAKKWDEPPYYPTYDDAENALLNRLIEISGKGNGSQLPEGRDLER